MSEKTSTATQATESRAKSSRTETTPPAAPGLAGSLLDLQSAVGNRGVERLLGRALLQPKLRIGPADDAYEREADRVAEAVLGNGPAAPISQAHDGGIQRLCAECQKEEEEEDLVQRKADGASASAPTPAFEARVASLRGSGRPLPGDLRSFFESRFGHDFGPVRVHDGSAASQAAREVNARAFTVGNDVVFGAGEWAPGTTAGKRLLAHELTHVVQQTPLVVRRKALASPAPAEVGEAEPPAGAEAPSGLEPEAAPPLEAAPSPPPAGGESGSNGDDRGEPTSAPEGAAPVEPGSEAPAAEQEPAAAAMLIVEDGAEGLRAGQMRKSEFLARLRREVEAAAEAGLAGTEHSAQGCPFIAFWFGYYEGQSAERFNRDLPRFVPGDSRPDTADGYIPIIAARVRASVATWARTGKITGVPRGLPLPGMSLPGLGTLATAAGGLLQGVLFKARAGGARDPGDPQALRDRLGAGRPLETTLRSRMESAFGQSFSHVRVHTDDTAAGLSDRLNARAFAISDHVAFGSGEYRPGTLVGDALIAHELAHVAQQAGASHVAEPSPSASAALEADADRAAVGAVGSLWGLLPGLGRPAAPRQRSGLGLRLSRCPSCGPKVQKTTLRLQRENCGKFAWYIRWSLDKVTTPGGWIVQEVDANFGAKDCENKPVDVAARAREKGANLRPRVHLWEAWRVPPNQTQTLLAQIGYQYDDVFDSVLEFPNTRGKYEVKAQADFHEGLELPASFGVNLLSPSVQLPMTERDPQLPEGTGKIPHNLLATWDCCPGSKSNQTQVSTE